MCRLLVAVLLSVAALSAAAVEVSGEPAWAPKAQPDLRFKAPAAAAAEMRLSSIDPARIDAVRRENATAQYKALKIGIEREIAQEASAPAAALTWRTLPDGAQVATLRATSPDATALRLALELPGLPSGAELRVRGAAKSASAEHLVDATEIEQVRAVQSRYWTPVTDGETQTVELYLPSGADARWFKPTLVAVSHLFVSPSGALDGAKIGESDSCEFDAKCVNNPSAGYLSAKNAVARMVFQSGGGSALCTGTLLNDTDTSTQAPYFYGAAHCFTTQSVASTLTTFWFYEATACGSGVLDSATARQVSGGATVLYANDSADVLFLRLNNAPPGGATFLGWTSATLNAGDEILVLHHPAGDVKKVSTGQVKGFGPSNLASGNFVQAGYINGTTEGGSSGCGLLTLNGSGYQLRGGLLGGGASCANTGSLSNPSNFDDFSRFDQIFPNLQSFLAPSSGPPAGTDFTGAWYNPQQSGWGYVILRGASGTYAIYIYHYDDVSSPSWYLSFGSLSGSTFNAQVLSFTGPWFGIVPFNPNAVTNRVSGNLSITFTSATTASTSFTIDGRTVTTTLTKLSY